MVSSFSAKILVLDFRFADARSQAADRVLKDAIRRCQTGDALADAQTATPAATPGGKLWDRKRARLLLSAERPALQGVWLSNADGCLLSDAREREVVGQAMAAGSLIPMIVALKSVF